MFRISNVRIGTKLAAASALSILLVVVMTANQAVNSNHLVSTMESGERKTRLTVGAAQAQGELLKMALAVRDARLAMLSEQLPVVANTFKERSAAFKDHIDGMLLVSVTAPTQEKTNALKAAGGKYVKIGNEIIEKKKEFFAVQDSTEFSTADADRVAAIKTEIERVAKEVGVPTATEAIKISDNLVDGLQKSTKVTQAEAATSAQYAFDIAMVLGALTILVLIGTAVFGSLSIARPLRNLTRPLAELAEGNFAVTVPGVGRGDEVGKIAQAVAAMAERVRATIGGIKSSTREVTNASAEIATSSTDLSQRTEEQAASLEQTSAAMEQLSATVQTNAQNAQRASESASGTRQVADRGGKVVSQAVDAMAKIEDSSRKISDIIGVIDEIARQTNLLALNAAVEAARAGEAGRGFAVVASEVRSLAQRSSQAAKDISELITNSNTQVRDGVDLVNRAGTALSEIVESIKSVSDIVSSIATASAEQATGLNEINKALSQMDEVTQQNSALVEENAATAKTLEDQARSMNDQVSYFQIDSPGAAEAATVAAPGRSARTERRIARRDAELDAA